jgi:transcriptional regulator with XRE-family HTH domain
VSPADLTPAARRATFGALIREHREAKGLSLSALAELAGVNRNAIALAESGGRGAQSRTVAVLVRALHLTDHPDILTLAAAGVGEGWVRVVDRDRCWWAPSAGGYALPESKAVARALRGGA